jgi:hypothetical protein
MDGGAEETVSLAQDQNAAIMKLSKADYQDTEASSGRLRSNNLDWLELAAREIFPAGPP